VNYIADYVMLRNTYPTGFRDQEAFLWGIHIVIWSGKTYYM